MAILASFLFAVASGETVELEIKGSSKPVRGVVVRENLKGITLEGPVLYPWAGLWKVNGRPAQERLQRVRLGQAASFCPDCRGGLVARVCSACLGSATLFAQSRECGTCSGKGAGADPCAEPGCERGRKPCPGPCFKRDAGVWKEERGAGRVRPFFIRTGKDSAATAFLGARHLGQVFEFKEVPPFPLPECAICHGSDQGPCARCRTAGTFVEAPPVAKGDCPRCGGPDRGAGKTACPSCFGRGKAPCETCFGAGKVPVRESAAACGACRKGIVSCDMCADTGLVDPKTLPKPTSLQAEVRLSLARVEGPVPPADRVTMRDGRSFEGTVLRAMKDGIVLLTGPETDLRAIALLATHGYRREPLPPPETPRPDTVLLKDGRTLRGRIVARSDELLMLRTSQGETLRLEAARIAEIRPRK